jgi:hypothetical protein
MRLGSTALATERVERRLAAILAADVAGYSRLICAPIERGKRPIFLKLEEPPPDRAPTAGELGRMSDVAGLQTARPVAYISRLLSPRGVCNSCVIAHRKHGSSGDGFGRGLTA